MTLTIVLTLEEEAKLVAQARARGVSADALARAAIQEMLGHGTPFNEVPQLRPEEIDRVLEEIADMIPKGIPALSDQALSRENIYTREDEWNRR